MPPHADHPEARARVVRALSRAGRVAAVLGLGFACAVAVASLADRVVAARGWDFVPLRADPNLDRELTRTEFSVRVVTNRLGFREPRLPGPKPPGTVRVVALGDSFTQGYGVAYPSRLEDLLHARPGGARYEVINLGVPAACPLDYLHHLRDPGLAYEPDVVLVGLMANDVHDVLMLRRHRARGVLAQLEAIRAGHSGAPGLRRVFRTAWPALYDLAGSSVAARRLRAAAGAEAEAAPSPGGQRRPERALGGEDVPWRDVLLALADRHGRRDEVASALDLLEPNERAMVRDVVTGAWRPEEHRDQTPAYLVRSLIAPRAHVDGVLLTAEYEDAWRATAAALREIDRVARAAGARTVLVFVPAGHQVNDASDAFFRRIGFPEEPRLRTDTTFADRVQAFGAEHGIAVVDLLAPLRERADERLYFEEDRHWTPRGHEIAAAVLATQVTWPLSSRRRWRGREAAWRPARPTTVRTRDFEASSTEATLSG